MEILPNRRGKPVLILHGQAEQRARLLGLTDFSVSLTHSRTDAMAFVVAIKSRAADLHVESDHREQIDQPAG